MASGLWSELKLSPVLKRMESIPEQWCDLIVEVFGNSWDKVAGFVESEQGKASRVIKLIPAMEVKLPATTVSGLAGLPFVRRVWSNTVVEPLSSGFTRPVIPWLHREETTGKGVVVALLDTGIRPWSGSGNSDKPLIGWADIVNGRETAYDDHGHGTYLARIIAGNGLSSGGTGIAPDARLVGVKVLNRQATGTLADLLLGIEWCLENQPEPIRVMAIPLKTMSQGNAYRDPLCRALTLAGKRGVLVCTGLESSSEQRSPAAESPGMHRRLLVAVNSEWPKNRRAGQIVVPDPDHPLFFRKSADISAAVGYISGTAACVLEEQSSASLERLRQAVIKRVWEKRSSSVKSQKLPESAVSDPVRTRMQGLAEQVITYLNQIDLQKLLKQIEFYQNSQVNEWIKVGIALMKALKISTAWEKMLRNSLIPELVKTGLMLLQEQLGKASVESGEEAALSNNKSPGLANLMETIMSGIQSDGDGLDPELQTLIMKLIQSISNPEPASG